MYQSKSINSNQSENRVDLLAYVKKSILRQIQKMTRFAQTDFLNLANQTFLPKKSNVLRLIRVYELE